MKSKDNTKIKNDANLDDFSRKTDPNYLRQATQDYIHDSIENTDWDKESHYHNVVYMRNGRWNKGRTIKMKNKEWHELQERNKSTS